MFPLDCIILVISQATKYWYFIAPRAMKNSTVENFRKRPTAWIWSEFYAYLVDHIQDQLWRFMVLSNIHACSLCIRPTLAPLAIPKLNIEIKINFAAAGFEPITLYLAACIWFVCCLLLVFKSSKAQLILLSRLAYGYLQWLDRIWGNFYSKCKKPHMKSEWMCETPNPDIP